MGCDAITDDEISLLKEITKCKKLLRAAIQFFSNLGHGIMNLSCNMQWVNQRDDFKF
jgi:hypothetical protein